MQLDDQDNRALHKLDDGFTISADGQRAVVTGEMEIEIARPDHDGGKRFWLMITFTGGETLDVRIARSQLLDQLDIGDDADAP